MNFDKPVFSRCSLGKGKWFWVSYGNFGDHLDGVVQASGIAKTASEAEDQARAAIMGAFGWDSPDQMPALYASHVYHRQVVKRRAGKASTTQEARNPEFVYRHDTSDYDSSWYSVPYRIVRKTVDRVYVENRCQSWEEDGQVFQDVRTFVLDRHKLETEGRVYNRRMHDAFYTTPYEERHKHDPRPPFLELLGVDAGCDVETLNAAYRSRAKQLHPDHGGDPAEFKRLQAAYEMALKTMQC